jgi:hypothetical protein
MSITWGAWEGSLGIRVGIEMSLTAVSHSSGSVTFTAKIYTENEARFADDQLLSYSGQISGTTAFTNNDSSGAQLRATKTATYTYSSYGSSPGTWSFGAALSGVFNGATPSVTVSLAIPARPYGLPAAVTSVSSTRNSDTQVTTTWTRHATTGEPYTSQTVAMRTYSGGAWGVWTTIATASATATSYVKTGLSANHAYQFEVRANNTFGSAAYDVGNTILMTPAAPSAVTAGLAPTGTSINVAWKNNAYDESNITFLVQRSVAGAAWVTVVTGIARTTPSWTDPSPGAGTNQYRVAAVQAVGSLSSAYGLSNVVSTIVAPLAPTNLAPNGAAADFAQPVTLTWKHNQGGDGAAQTHYTIEISTNGGTTWTALASATNVASSSMAHTISAGVLTNGTSYLWRVRTEGIVSGGFSPNPASASITGSAKPTVTLTLPAAATTTLPIVAAWDYNQDQLSPQTQWQADLYDVTGVTLLEERAGFDAAATVSFTYSPVDATSYLVAVRARSGAGLWSNWATQVTAFNLLPPAGTTLDGSYQPCSGAVILSIAPVAPVDGVNVTTATVTIERRVAGGDWVELVSGLVVPTDFEDTLPLTHGLNEYRVTSLSALPSSLVGPVLSVMGTDGDTSGDPLWAWVSWGDNFQTVLKVHGDLDISETTGRLKATQNFLGRTRPVALIGQNTARSIVVGGALHWNDRCVLDDGCTFDSAPDDWHEAGQMSEVVCYRDYTGRRFFGLLSDVTVGDGIWPTQAKVSFGVTEVDFTEAYASLPTGSPPVGEVQPPVDPGTPQAAGIVALATSTTGTLVRIPTTLVPGSYVPDSSTTGLTNAALLTDWSGSNIFSVAGATYTNLKFNVGVDIRAANVTFKNCWFAGNPVTPGNYLVNCQNAGASNVTFESCLFLPTTPAVTLNCIQGRNYTLLYCDISRGVDLVRANYPTDGTLPLNITIQQCYLHDLTYYLVDPAQGGGETHNDAVQFQGSKGTNWGSPPAWVAGAVARRNVLIRWNNFDVRYSTDTGDFGSLPDRGTGDDTNGRRNFGDLCGIQFTPLGALYTEGVDIWDNRITGGYRGVNAGSATTTDLGSVWRNLYDDTQGGRSALTAGGGWTLNMDATTTCAAGDGVDQADTANANHYLAEVPTVGGQVITVRRNQ